jgi:hypothetical protein
MAAIHAATASPLTTELTADMRTELVMWLELWAPSLAAENRITPEIVERCVGHIIDEACEHVQIRFAATLATFGVEIPQ